MSDKIYIDTAYTCLKKYGEELCGDRVNIVKNDDRYIAVLSDGLGSGVKANILSTLTSKIISTMMKNGSSIEDTVDTIVHTLPVCNIRKVAYSTFSILEITSDKDVYLVEFDSPNCIFIRDNQVIPIDYNIREIAGKTIKEARFKIETDDVLVLISDGVIYAGIGAMLSLGWGWENAAEFMCEKYCRKISSSRFAKCIADKCNELYVNKPGDDTTIAVIKAIPQRIVSLFSGPPQNPKEDARLIQDFMKDKGMKIVCGGSSATIASRILGQEIEASIDYLDPEIPPIGSIKGIDLVTEGVITLKRAVNIIKKYYEDPADKLNLELIDAEHGAAKIARILIEDCTHLNLFIGRKVNPAHQLQEVAGELSIKMLVLDELYKLMEKSGKVVTRKYY